MSLRLSAVNRSNSRARQHARSRRNRRLWVLEGLEGRVLLSGNPTIYTVTDTSDNVSDTGSLPYAINQANNQGEPGYAAANSAGSVIQFDIPTTDPGYDALTGSWTITTSSGLELSESDGPEVIQGAGANVLTISGDGLGVAVDGGVTATISDLTFFAVGSSAESSGIVVGSGATATITGNSISGCYEGIRVFGAATITGNTITGSFGDGIDVRGAATIGGTSAGAGNTIFGNNTSGFGGSSNISLAGGSTATILGNSISGLGEAISSDIEVGGAATIGGTSAGAGNTISGVAGAPGIWIQSPGTATILGNSIHDNYYGILVDGAATIGGTTTGAGNALLNNQTGEDILITSAGTATILGNSGNDDIVVYGSATIGGTSTGAGNALSGIVVESGGTATILGNSIGALEIYGSATIGGTSTGAGNSIDFAYPGDADCIVVGSSGTATILGNSIARDGPGAGIEVYGAATIGGTSAGAGNSFSCSAAWAIGVDPGATATILGNSISGQGYGIAVGGAATIGGTSTGAGNSISGLTASGGWPGTGIFVQGGTATIVGNSISDNSDGGIFLEDGGAATITDDSITGNGTGILVGSGADDTCLVTAQDDDLSGNTMAGLTNNQTNPAYAVAATDDWWGSEHGPTATANPGGNGTSVSSNVSFSPWIGVYSHSATLGFFPTGITLYAVPTQLVFVTEPSATVIQGVAFATQPVVEAEDGGGNLGINFDAATVPGVQAVMTLNTISGAGTLGGTTVVSPSGGFASFNGLNITGIGTYTLTASSSGFDGLSLSGTSTQVTTAVGLIYVLDRSAGGALTVSGNASINVPGGVFVDSSSTSALSASGNAKITAPLIDVHGGVQKSGNASFSPALATGAPIVADPLVGLTAPTYSGTPISENLSGSSKATITPGVYSQITVSGSASLTLCPGVYVIAGGGLSVSGNAGVAVSGPISSLTGTGVMIYNTKSSTGTYGSVTLSGNGAISLTPPTTGTYAGILIFQDRNNAKALTFSGNAVQGITGTIYAPAAQLAESGNAQIGSTSNPVSIIVDTLTISGNSVANTVSLSSPTGAVAYSPAQIRAAYGISALGLDGTGQTIAIVDAYDDPSIFQALDAFDNQFGLTSSGPTLYGQYGPASSFLTVLNQNGQATSLPSTDPLGPGTDNWEVEEALDVEWAHAIAPGAQIILVEANSQSLSDLMAGVATAAAQPGVSVVSMSWGFAEGQAVFAGDEAAYDRVFATPGVTFVASTGDYGAADPEYPAYSPNVVAVGGTSLTLNGDGSYNSETGWGYNSASLGTFIGSGGGMSLYEPEPAFQQGVQSTGSRTTPDVSLVADPATGAWIADPYNLDPSNPFEVVGGTSLSAPAWAGLLALVNQGRAGAGQSTLNSSSPTETQQALYMLPQSDYNAIASGSNGYTAGAGYNLVTGLGTPVANLLVPDLVAYQGPGTTYPGPTVAPLQDAGLVNTGTSDEGPMDVFSVFDSLMVTSNGIGVAQGQVPGTYLTSGVIAPLAPNGTSRASAAPVLAGGFTFGAGPNPSPAGLMALSPAGTTIARATPGLMSRQPASSRAQAVINTPRIPEQFIFQRHTDHDNEHVPFLKKSRTGLVVDSVLDELASDLLVQGVGVPASIGEVALTEAAIAVPAIPIDSMPGQNPSPRSAGDKLWLTDVLFAIGFGVYGAGTLAATSQRRVSAWPKRRILKLGKVSH